MVGDTSLALVYEIEEMTRCINEKINSENLQLTIDTMLIMDKVREKWDITYLFE